jgi:hypothetical protein
MMPSRRWSQNLLLLFAVAAALIVAVTPRGFGQPEQAAKPKLLRAADMEIFRYLFHEKGIEPRRSIEEAMAEPGETIIVLVGPDSLSHRFVANALLTAFHDGASVLIASDQSSQNTLLGRLFGVEIANDLVTAAEEDCYRNNLQDPFVRPIRALFEDDASSPRTIFAQLDGAGAGALATNNASFLRIHSRNALKPQALAGYPFSARGARAGELDPGKDLFAAGAHQENGRLLVLADHSVFTNGMVWKEDNANLEFARSCIDWLKGAEKKSHCLFVEDGVIRTDFDLPMVQQPPKGLLWKLLAARHLINHRGNALLTEVEERNGLNSMLLSKFDLRTIVRSLLIVLTGLVLLAGFSMLIRNRVHPDPARTLVTPELAALIPRGNVLQQRFDGLLEADNVYEPARQLVREFFAGMDAEPDAQGRPPQIDVVDGYNDSAGLCRRIMRLWTIGFASTPVKVLSKHWSELARDLQEVLQDADEGWWRFVMSH